MVKLREPYGVKDDINYQKYLKYKCMNKLYENQSSNLISHCKSLSLETYLW